MFSKYLSLPWNVKQRLACARATVRDWVREDARYFCMSTLIHAVLIVSLALLPWQVISHMTSEETDRREVASFAPAEQDRGSKAERVEDIIELKNAPLDETELNAKTIADMKDLPIGFEDGEKNVKPEDAGDPNGDPQGDKASLVALGNNGEGDHGMPGPKQNGPGPVADIGIRGPYGDRVRRGPHQIGSVTRPSERAVAAGLNWLARHQSLSGQWSLDHRSRCKAGAACSGAGLFKSDAAATGLAILPFLAAGETHRGGGKYEKHVSDGLIWLMKQQQSSGDLSGPKGPKPDPKPMYAHSICAIALCEAYGMTKDDQKTRDEKLGSAARKAVNFIERAQNESTGGWRYTPGETGDTSVFGWQIMALKAAQLAGIEVDSVVFDRAQIWLNSVAKGERLGLYSYQPYREVTPTMTAVGMLSRQYLGISPKDPSILEGKAYLLQNLPDDTIARNSYYWYYAALSLHNFDDEDWLNWNRRMRRILIESQAKEGCATGSWDPLKPSTDYYGEQGGRLMTTCLNTMTLEVSYRHLPLFQTDSFLPKRPNSPPAEEK
jgi:hypothetical protein